MAGKHIGGDLAVPTFIPQTAHNFSPKLDKAYAEGRAGVPAANPHPTGSPAFEAYAFGATNAANGAFQYETAVP